jgi:hypothetical protein
MVLMPQAPHTNRRPSAYLPADREACVQWLATLSLTELRKRQGIASSAIRMAFDSKNTAALMDHQAIFDMTTAAIDRQFFGGLS